MRQDIPRQKMIMRREWMRGSSAKHIASLTGLGVRQVYELRVSMELPPRRHLGSRKVCRAIAVYMSDSERAAIGRAARMEGMSASEWSARHLLAALPIELRSGISMRAAGAAALQEQPYAYLQSERDRGQGTAPVSRS